MKLKVASFNVALCPSLRNSFDQHKQNIINFITTKLQDCDLVLLQEASGSWTSPCINSATSSSSWCSMLSVMVGTIIPTTYSNLRQDIIDSTNSVFPYSFASSQLKRYACLCPLNVYDTGLLILSKHELTDCYEEVFDRNIDLGMKGMLHCKIENVHIMNTHLIPDSYGTNLANRLRKDQLKDLKSAICHMDEVIIGGDFNICSTTDVPQYKAMLTYLELQDTACSDGKRSPTYIGDIDTVEDDQRIDYILSRSLESRNNTVYITDVSDHRPISVELYF